MPTNAHANADRETAGGRRPVAASQRISDYHLSAGAVLADGSANDREDFTGDDAYVRLLSAFARRFPQGTALTLEWGGDMVDFHALQYRGRYGNAPTVEAALAKLEACFAGHRKFWDATHSFLSVPGRALEITIGNHDFEFAWPEAQARIRKRLGVPEGDRRVSFVTDVAVGDALRIHGDMLDPMNAIPPESNWFISDRDDGRLILAVSTTLVLAAELLLIPVFRLNGFTDGDLAVALVGGVGAAALLCWALAELYHWRWGKDKKFLNVPYGTVLNSTLGQALRNRRPWVGRMKSHRSGVMLSLARDWYFGAIAFVMLVLHAAYNRFFVGLHDIRRKAKLGITYQIIKSMVQEADLSETEMAELLEHHPGVRVVIAGHTHEPGVRKMEVLGREITYFNTGTGIDQVRIVQPAINGFRTSFPRVESFFRRIAAQWREEPRLAIGFTFIIATAAGAPFFARRLFGWFYGWTAWALAAALVLWLLLRQSFAMHKDETYTLYTLVETVTYGDGTKARNMLRFIPEAGRFEEWTGQAQPTPVP